MSQYYAPIALNLLLEYEPQTFGEVNKASKHMRFTRHCRDKRKSCIWIYERTTIAHLSEPKMCARTVRGLMKIQLTSKNIGFLCHVSNDDDGTNPLKNWVPKGKVI